MTILYYRFRCKPFHLKSSHHYSNCVRRLVCEETFAVDVGLDTKQSEKNYALSLFFLGLRTKLSW